LEATRILREEHDVILRGLSVLSVMAAAGDRGELPPAQDASDIVEFIRKFSDALHHHKEEGLLFPVMERAGFPRDGGPVGVMLAEHEEGRRLVSRAEAALAETGSPADAAKAFGRAAGEFVVLMRNHIAKENDILFNIADQRIEEAAAAALDMDFAEAVEAQAVGLQTQIAKLEALEARYLDAVA